MRIQIAEDIRVELYLISDGTLLLVPGYGFTPLFDHYKDGVCAMFDGAGFSLTEPGNDEPQSYNYHTPYPYKRMPVLTAWLVQQNLIMPEQPQM